MSQPYLSMARAKSLVVEIVESSPPGSRNPTNEHLGFCTYLCHKTGRRCIVGELLHRMHMPAPPYDNGFTHFESYSIKGYMSARTVKLLGEIQSIFDGPDEIPPTWRQALKQCREEGLL